jgi:outer membrane protein OmpU
MTAGMAAAEVSLSGYAEIGIAGADIDGVDTDMVFHSDLDVKFTLSGETDGGLTFGATIDLDEVGDDADPVGDSIANTNANGSPTEEHSVFVSGDFGTITMGDTDGAFDWAMAEVWWGTTLTDDHTAHIVGDLGLGANSGLDGIANGQVARYDYSFGDFAFAVSAEIGDSTGNADAYGVGFKYNMDLGGTTLGFGLGYQDGETTAGTDTDVVGVSLDMSFAGGFNARLNYQDGEIGTTDFEHAAIGLAYVSGPLLVEANYGQSDIGGWEPSGVGFAVNYDLGGGAVVMVGYGDSDGDGVVADFSTWSAGLGLSF